MGVRHHRAAWPCERGEQGCEDDVSYEAELHAQYAKHGEIAGSKHLDDITHPKYVFLLDGERQTEGYAVTHWRKHYHAVTHTLYLRMRTDITCAFHADSL